MGKATTEEKRRRLVNLYRYIQEKKRVSVEEVTKHLKTVDERQARNYLYDLEALGLITHDEETKTYVLATAGKRREFASKADHELAVEHSKKLLFSTSEKQLFDLMNPDTWADDLVFSPWRHELLLQHLKTGYFDSIYLLLEKYKRITPPPLGAEVVPTVITPRGYFGPYPYTENETEEPEREEDEREEDEKIITMREKLRREIAEKLCALMWKVEHGIPLEGECDCCPHLHITVKDSS
jgi:hypothetical protein